MAEAKGSFDYGGGGGGGAKRDGAKSGSGSGEAKDAPSVTGGGGSAVAEAKGDQTSASPSVTVRDLVITPEDGPLCGPFPIFGRLPEFNAFTLRSNTKPSRSIQFLLYR